MTTFEDRLTSYVQHTSVDALTDRLLASTDSSTALDVVWTIHDSAIGPLLLAFRDSAVVRVAFETEDFDAVVEHLGSALGPRTLRSGRSADALRRQLDEYFDGSRTRFDVAHDLILSSAPFRRSVQESLPAIPYGHTASYAQVAASAGRPKAVRAVGSACATNPLPIVLPCHRVLRSDGAIGHYLGGTDLKRTLLDIEARHAA